MDSRTIDKRRKRRRWLPQSLWVLALVAAAVVFYHQRMSIRLVPAERAPTAGELAVRDPAGRVHRLADMRGEVLLINLWASWCGPCRREVPRLSRLQAELAPQGLKLWALNAESFQGAELQRVADEFGIDYPAMTPVDGYASSLGGGEVLPYIWLIDRQGRIRASHGGLVPEASLRRACRKLLGERS